MIHLVDQLKEIRDLMDTVETLVTQGDLSAADDLMVTVKSKVREIHNSIWLSHHKSGVGLRGE